MQRDALLILVKNPVAGQTKTRLAATVGHPMALRMYGMLMDYTRNQTVALTTVDRYLLYSDHVAEDAWPDTAFRKGVQVGADLGARMANAFRNAFAAGHERVCIIGSDCPGITTELLGEAFDLLAHKDVVLGPALDGGYYLLGTKKFHPALFAGMEWSTETVAEETRARAQVQNLSLGELVALSDVDYIEDWEHYGWPLPNPGDFPPL